MQGITVMCSRRGGDLSCSSHCEWLLTVPSKPDAIRFSFIPITSLLKGISGNGFLSHAINLYLRCEFPLTSRSRPAFDISRMFDTQIRKDCISPRIYITRICISRGICYESILVQHISKNSYKCLADCIYYAIMLNAYWRVIYSKTSFINERKDS